MRALMLSGALALAATAAQATGMYECDPVDAASWLTEEQLTAKIAVDGWKVRRMKKDGGCWEVYGTTPDGDRVEAYFHPATGDVLLINQRGKILYRVEE